VSIRIGIDTPLQRVQNLRTSELELRTQMPLADPVDRSTCCRASSSCRFPDGLSSHLEFSLRETEPQFKFVSRAVIPATTSVLEQIKRTRHLNQSPSAMSYDLITWRDHSHTELSRCLPLTEVEADVRHGTRTYQRDNNRQRLSAAMALTVRPVQLPVTESDRPPCRGLDMRKVWRSTTYQMDATPGASKPMSAASAHFEQTLLIGSSN
jgi:hypothetical protein